MALRVLLADESVTIKKAFELALQDYGVDVVSVNAGVDVVPVAMKFKPDIIFADVLIQKKNGYDLCQELKSLEHTQQIPVVLIWSGFMELDQQKFRQSKANAELEKPFDTDKLRSLVQSLVPRLSSQKLSSYLDFPSLPDFEEKPPQDVPDMTHTNLRMAPEPESEPETPAEEPKQESTSNPDPDNEETVGSWSMSQFEDISNASEDDEFSEFSLQPESNTPAREETATSLDLDQNDDDNDTPWVSQTLSQFKIDKNKLNAPDEVSYEVPEDTIDPDTLIRNHQTNTSKWATNNKSVPPPLSKQNHNEDDDEAGLELEFSTEATSTQPATPAISDRQVEAIIKAQAREIIEKVVWEVVPEIATQIIERELKKLIQEQKDQELD